MAHLSAEVVLAVAPPILPAREHDYKNNGLRRRPREAKYLGVFLSSFRRSKHVLSLYRLNTY